MKNTQKDPLNKKFRAKRCKSVIKVWVLNLQAVDIQNTIHYTFFWGISAVLLLFSIAGLTYILKFNHLLPSGHVNLLFLLWACFPITLFCVLTQFVFPNARSVWNSICCNICSLITVSNSFTKSWNSCSSASFFS